MPLIGAALGADAAIAAETRAVPLLVEYALDILGNKLCSLLRSIIQQPSQPYKVEHRTVLVSL